MPIPIAIPVSSLDNGTFLQPGSRAPAVGADVFAFEIDSYTGPGTGTPITTYTDDTGGTVLSSLGFAGKTDFDGQPPGFVSIGEELVTLVGRWRGQEIIRTAIVAGSLNPGPDGPPGVGADWQGPYNSGTAYTKGQGVSEAGRNFISQVNANTGHDPITETEASNFSHWSPLLPGTVIEAADIPGGALAPNGARTSTFNISSLRDHVSALDSYFGTVEDGKFWTGAAVAGSTVALPGTFSLADEGKMVVLAGCGASGDSAVKTIVNVSDADHATLNSAVTTNQAATTIHYGTDNGVSLRNLIGELIATGADGLTPRGRYLYTGTLDFSAMSGTWKGCGFRGEGGGGFDLGLSSATALWYAGQNEALTAFGDSEFISGLKVGGFVLKCLRPLGASKFAWYWDNVAANFELKDIIVAGCTGTDLASFSHAQQGNGIWVNNFSIGAGRIAGVHSRYWNGPASVGQRWGTATTGHAAAANSGNLSFHALTSIDATIAFHLKSEALTNGCELGAMKAVWATEPTGGGNPFLIGFLLDASFRGNTFVSAHSEGFITGIDFDGASNNTLLSILVANGGTGVGPGDDSTALLFRNGASGNNLPSATLNGVYDYWITLEDGALRSTPSGGANKIPYTPDGFTPRVADIKDTGGLASSNTLIPLDVVAAGRQALTPASAVTAGSPVPYARLRGDGTVELGGVLHTTGAKSPGDLLATIPVGVRPDLEKQPVVNGASLDIDPATGHVMTSTAILSGVDVAIDCVQYVPAALT